MLFPLGISFAYLPSMQAIVEAGGGIAAIAGGVIFGGVLTIVGLSAALGVGIAQASASMSQFPPEVTIIFGKSPVVIATIMAVVLNVILPKEN